MSPCRNRKSVSLLMAAALIATMTPSQASRPVQPSDPGRCAITGSTCDPSGATFTCQDEQCSTVDIGPGKIGSQKVVADKNVHMKTCVAQKGGKCSTKGVWCADIFIYLLPGCVGTSTVSREKGYQTTCG